MCARFERDYEVVSQTGINRARFVVKMLLRLGNPIICHEEVLSLQTINIIPSKRILSFFPPDRGMLRRSRCVQIFAHPVILLVARENKR